VGGNIVYQSRFRLFELDNCLGFLIKIVGFIEDIEAKLEYGSSASFFCAR
jgi:hypothetical protein